jgi:SAM-dependent methyltransferase
MALVLEENERAVLYNFAVEKLSSLGVVGRVADLAPGTGGGAYIIAKNLPQTQVFGLDLSAEAVKSAEKSFSLANLFFKLGDVTVTPWNDGYFDAVVSFHTIEHMDEANQNKFLSEIGRILKAGGVLLMATPDRDVLEIQGFAGAQPDHVRELNQEEFLRTVRNNGFVIDAICGQSVLKGGRFPLRRLLNFLKKLDVFNLRKKISPKLVNVIDMKTHPVDFGKPVKRLADGEKASTTVLICRKPS